MEPIKNFSIKSFPNNQDTYIGAEEVMRWLHGRTSGVFAAGANAAVTALADPKWQVHVSDGNGWMSNANHDGIVWWNDYEAKNGSKLSFGIDEADGTLHRIDRIIVEWQTTTYVALPEIKVLKGIPSSIAVAPALTNNSTLRQISLAQIRVAAGTTGVDASMITDERLDSSVCGLVTESISIDTSMMQNQFEALLKAIQNELLDLEAGTGAELKKLQFNNTSVAVADFVDDTTYEDYLFRATIPLEGVLESMIPEIIFSLSDATSGLFAPVAESYNGGVYLYASDVPETDVTVPVIICWKGNA